MAQIHVIRQAFNFKLYCVLWQYLHKANNETWRTHLWGAYNSTRLFLLAGTRCKNRDIAEEELWRLVHTRDIYDDFRCDFFGEENRTNIALKFEILKHLRYCGDVNLQNCSKIAGCSSLRRHLGFSRRPSWIFGLCQNAVKTYFFASNLLNNFIR